MEEFLTLMEVDEDRSEGETAALPAAMNGVTALQALEGSATAADSEGLMQTLTAVSGDWGGIDEVLESTAEVRPTAPNLRVQGLITPDVLSAESYTQRRAR